MFFLLVFVDEEQTTVFDLRNLNSNQLQDFRTKISMDDTSLLNIDSKAEIITLDKLLNLSNEQLVINEMHIYLNEDTNDEFVLYFLFKILAKDNFTVVLIFVLYNDINIY